MKEALQWDFIREKVEKENINPLEYFWFASYFDAAKNAG
jgi:hypothetical protein